MRACGAGTLAIYMKAGDREKGPVSFSVRKKGDGFPLPMRETVPLRFRCAAGMKPGRLLFGDAGGDKIGARIPDAPDLSGGKRIIPFFQIIPAAGFGEDAFRYVIFILPVGSPLEHIATKDFISRIMMHIVA